jgi:hypothetical protein
MQRKLAIKRLSGTKANTLEVLLLPPGREVIFGRDRECHVRYAEADDLVSRKHLKIVATNDEPARYMLIDLGSRNGTFVNRQRVFGSVVLLPGARVQLGGGGPEFEFRTEVEERGHASRRARRSWFVKAALVILICAAGGAAGYRNWPRTVLLWRQWRSAQAHRVVKPEFNRAAASASVVDIAAEWRVIDQRTGVRLARAEMANAHAAGAESLPLVEGGAESLPLFVLGADGRLEPLLVPAGTLHAGPIIQGEWKCKGVVVSEAGAVLAAGPSQPWDATYRWPLEETAGALVVLEGQEIARVAPLAAGQFPNWTLGESGFLAEQLPEGLHGELRGRRVGHDDVRAEVTATVRHAGRAYQTQLMGEPSGFWYGIAPPEMPPAGIRAPPFAYPLARQPVWVVGDEIEKAVLQDGGAQRLTLSSRCRGGGVVFDREGRVVALCIPGQEARPAMAIPVRRGLDLLSGAKDGLSK